MKNAIAISSFGLAVGVVGWSFGSGSLHAESAGLLLLAWIGISWSCMQD